MQARHPMIELCPLCGRRGVGVISRWYKTTHIIIGKLVVYRRLSDVHELVHRFRAIRTLVWSRPHWQLSLIW